MTEFIYDWWDTAPFSSAAVTYTVVAAAPYAPLGIASSMYFLITSSTPMPTKIARDARYTKPNTNDELAGELTEASKLIEPTRYEMH